MIKNVAGLTLMVALALPVGATQMTAYDLTIEKIHFNTGTAANVGHRGEVWIKVNRAINNINPGCPNDNWYNVNGYLVAAFADDQFRQQNIAGLLAAKAAGSTIAVTVDDARKNVSGICSISWYQVD